MIYLVVRQYDVGLTVIECAATTEAKALLELTRCAQRYQTSNPTERLDIRGNVFYFEGVRFRILTTELLQ